MESLSGKCFVVTGANRGIGKQIVERIVEVGGSVYACMRNVESAYLEWSHNIVKDNDTAIMPIVLDLSSDDSIKKASKEILSGKKAIDGIVNNAGITGPVSMFSMMTMEEIRETFEVNFFGPSFFTQRLLKNMIRNKRGSIVNISSVASLDGEPAQYAYVASKSAVNGATKKLASELASFGIRVNAVCPGMIDTEMGDVIEEQLESKLLNVTALARKGTATEIADIVRFLLSDESSFITGQIIRADGGKF